MTHVGVIVGDFPLRSETFIVRLVDLLARTEHLRTTVLVCGGLDVVSLADAQRSLDALRNVRVVSLSRAMTRPRKAVELVQAYVTAGTSARRPLTRRYATAVSLGDRVRASRLTRLVEEYGPFDVLHAQFIRDARWLLPAFEATTALHGTRLVISSRGRDTTGPGALDSLRSLRLLMAAHDVVVAPVARHLADVILRHGVPAARVAVVPSPLDPHTLRFASPSSRPAALTHLLFVGRLVEKKGVRHLLEAFAGVAEEVPRLHLTIVGDGPERTSLERFVRAHALTERVRFTGAVRNREVLEHMRRSHFTVVPSCVADDGDTEGLPNVAKEAMACGSVVIASDHGALSELIRDGATGFSFAEGDVPSARSAILRAVGASSRWDAIARGARESVEREFGYESVRLLLTSAYSRVVSGAEGSG